MKSAKVFLRSLRFYPITTTPSSYEYKKLKAQILIGRRLSGFTQIFFANFGFVISWRALREMYLEKSFTRSPQRFFTKVAKIFILSQQHHPYMNTKDGQHCTDRIQMTQIKRIYTDSSLRTLFYLFLRGLCVKCVLC